LWSEAILEELHLQEQYKLIDRGSEPDAALAAADHLLGNMRIAFDDAVVPAGRHSMVRSGSRIPMTSRWSRLRSWVVQA